jgi:alpha-glucan, water dikinase
MGAPSSAPTREAYSSLSEFKADALTLSVATTRRADSDAISVAFARKSGPVQGADEQLMLHWGIVPAPNDDRSVYVRPPDVLAPPSAETDKRPGEPSMQSCFTRGGTPTLTFSFSERDAPAGIVFLVVVKNEKPYRGQWLKGPGGGSFFVDTDAALSKGERARREELVLAATREEGERAERERAEKLAQAAERDRLLALEAERRDARDADAERYLLDAVEGGKLFAQADLAYDFGRLSLRAVLRAEDAVEAEAEAEAEADRPDEEDPMPAKLVVASTLAFGGADVILHHGVKRVGAGCSGWCAPPLDACPPGTVRVDEKAVQTRLTPHGDNGLHVAVFDKLPRGVVGWFAVLHVPNAAPHLRWIKAAKGGGDIYLPLTPKPPLKGLPKDYPISDVAISAIENIIEREMEYGSWTLMHRYSYGNHLVEAQVGHDVRAWGALYVWMRYSQIQVLDWQRSYNTQPRQLSAAQLSFVTCLANRFCKMPDVRWIARLVMSCVGRGGSGDLGQRIRDDILVILRHNRGWGHGSMMEQWHQKLHNATDPTDVVICDALLAFWNGDGDRAAYWSVLLSNGVTRERLASYQQAVTAEPDFVGHIRDTMLHELGRYGALLRAVHLGTDLHSIVDRCQALMHGDTRDAVNAFMDARHNGSFLDTLRAVAGAREALNGQIVFGGSGDHDRRDLIFLDLALEADARRYVESSDGAGHDGTLWSHLVSIRAASRSLRASEAGLKTEGDLERAIHDLQAVIDRLERQGESHDVGLRAAAALTILRNVVTEIVDRYEGSLGPLARCMGSAFRAESSIVSTFIEESVRGGPAFVLSTLLRRAGPAVRRIANLGPYSVIAPHHKVTTGPVVVFHKLRESTGAVFKRGTVVVADVCDGDEDVPANTEYVVIGSTVDVLSHVSVRARNERHGLIACLDADELARLRTMHGCIVRAKLAGDAFTIDVIDEKGRMSPSAGVRPVMRRVLSSSGIVTPPSGTQTPPLDLLTEGLLRRRVSAGGGSGSQPPAASPSACVLARKLSANTLKALDEEKAAVSEHQLAAPWAIRPSAFNVELVGSKSLNLQRVVALGIPDWIKTPPSLAIPNGAMRKVLGYDANKGLAEQYEAMLRQVRQAKPGDVKLCPKLRSVINALEAPEGLNEALRGVLHDLGCEDLDAALPGAWKAVKGVWASVWNERAHLARQKLGLNFDNVDMAVLCQKVIDADYAFVIHTTNPLTGDKNEIYAECVVGLGETLVGNAPGQALGFTVRKDQDLDSVVPIVRSYPSKATALVGGQYIFRSDSNAEDLDGFAGAGLHDSIPIVENEVVDIDYSTERLMSDDEFRVNLMRAIAKVGVEVEDAMGGSPQDIEGVYKDGELTVVQSRPQI